MAKKVEVNNDKMAALQEALKKIEKDLDNAHKSLATINNLLNQSVNSGLVRGMRGKAFKSWAKKAKSQSTNALRVKEKLNEAYIEDVAKYPIKQLDDRIAALEKELEELSKLEVKQ